MLIRLGTCSLNLRRRCAREENREREGDGRQTAAYIFCDIQPNSTGEEMKGVGKSNGSSRANSCSVERYQPMPTITLVKIGAADIRQEILQLLTVFIRPAPL